MHTNRRLEAVAPESRKLVLGRRPSNHSDTS
jgi:hypothetical protein